MRAARSLLLLLLSATALSTHASRAQAQARSTLDIYYIDTEGGGATLFVTPTGQSALIDSGNPGARDLDRIVATIGEAGIRELDYLVSTHYHVDHIGGMQELAKRIPIRTYVDHGPSVETNEQVAGFQAAYAALRGQARHLVVKPGDRLPLTGVDWRIVTSAGQTLTSALPGGGQANPLCSSFQRKQSSPTDENYHSVGSVVTLGEFRTIALGDLLWDVDYGLACPTNKVGPIDLYLTTHHGLATSGSPTLTHALRPRVAVMNNGTRKGGAVETFQILHSSPGLQDLWQLHWSYAGGVEHNSPGVFIANLDEPAVLASVIAPPPAPAAGAQGAGGGAARPGQHNTGSAYFIKVSARPDGSFTVTNTRNGFSKTYAGN